MARIQNISRMWDLLDVVTGGTSGMERRVNHLNEWGGFSRRLGIPVFTAWVDQTPFEKQTKMTSAIVADSSWEGSPVGVNNQERWVDYALAHGGDAAYFVIHAVDISAIPRTIADIDGDRIIVGKIRREGTQSMITGQPRELAVR